MAATDFVILHGDVVTPDRLIPSGYVVVQGDTIHGIHGSDWAIPSDMASCPVVASPQILPGFVDIHNHGLGGCDEVMDHWQHPEFSLTRLAATGTTTVIASIIFSEAHKKAVEETIRVVESYAQRRVDNCCVIEGLHAEGPIIGDPGGLPASERSITVAEFKRLCATMPHLRIMTISPSEEKHSNFKRLKHLCEIGVRPSLGHDRKASESDIIYALNTVQQYSANPKVYPAHSTHLCNVMSFHHRQPSLINFLLCRQYPAHPKYAFCTPPTVEVIADLIHVHPVTLSAIFSARQPTRDIALISDCISAYVPGRRLKYDGREILVKAEGGCYLVGPPGQPPTTLAGSTVTLADQLYSLVNFLRVDLVAACRMLATTPSAVAGVDDRVGSVAVGKKANLLCVDMEHCTVERVMVYGKWVEAKPYRMLRPSQSHL